MLAVELLEEGSVTLETRRELSQSLYGAPTHRSAGAPNVAFPLGQAKLIQVQAESDVKSREAF